jgi:hypothetical protein
MLNDFELQFIADTLQFCDNDCMNDDDEDAMLYEYYNS